MEQAAQNIVLGAAVHQNDFPVTLAVLDRLAPAHLGDQIDLVGIVKSLLAGEQDDAAEHGALVAQPFGQGAGIDAVQGGNAVLRQPLRQAPPGVPVAVFGGMFRDDQALHMDPVRFEIVFDAIDQLVSGHTIVADEGIGQDQDLAVIGGIGEGLRIADHAGVKDHFAGCRVVRAEGEAVIDRAVLQFQSCFQFFEFHSSGPAS